MDDEDLGLAAMLVPLVAAIDIGPLDGNAGQALNMLDLPGEGVAIVGIAGQRLVADWPTAVRALVTAIDVFPPNS